MFIEGLFRKKVHPGWDAPNIHKLLVRFLRRHYPYQVQQVGIVPSFPLSLPRQAPSFSIFSLRFRLSVRPRHIWCAWYYHTTIFPDCKKNLIFTRWAQNPRLHACIRDRYSRREGYLPHKCIRRSCRQSPFCRLFPASASHSSGNTYRSWSPYRS